MEWYRNRSYSYSNPWHAWKCITEGRDLKKEKTFSRVINISLSEDDVEKAISIFEKYGSIEYTRNIALNNVSQAKELLKILDDSEAKEALLNIADFVLQRNF